MSMAAAASIELELEASPPAEDDALIEGFPDLARGYSYCKRDPSWFASLPAWKSWALCQTDFWCLVLYLGAILGLIGWTNGQPKSLASCVVHFVGALGWGTYMWRLCTRGRWAKNLAERSFGPKNANKAVCGCLFAQFVVYWAIMQVVLWCIPPHRYSLVGQFAS
jgi:hypothetical protein